MIHKIYFYNPNKLEVFNAVTFIPKTGLDCWIDLSFFNLLDHFQNDFVQLVSEIPDEGIIIFHPKFFPKNIIPLRSQYFVCAQADFGRHRYAQMHLVQNPFQRYSFLTNKRFWADMIFSYCDNIYLPHWPHPKLINRNESRGSILENVAYFGELSNFDSNLILELPNYLEPLDMKFFSKILQNEIFDYSTVDLTLAIRSFPAKKHWNKPFWKLLNAVLSGSLIIASNESSSIEFRNRFFNDLPIVKSEEELKRTIELMYKNPQLFFSSLNNARENLRKSYTNDLLNKWVLVLEKANKNLEEWRRLSNLERNIFIKYRTI